MPTENIGPVSATCDENTSDTDCLRVLADEACKLGGDVVWGVGGLSRPPGKRVIAGRAAHSSSVGK